MGNTHGVKVSKRPLANAARIAASRPVCASDEGLGPNVLAADGPASRIGSAFVVGGAVGLIFHGLYLGMAVGGLLCALYILGGRRWVRARLDRKGTPLKSNADAFVGEKGLVLARIAPHQAGRVRVKHEEWRAVLAEGATTPIDEGVEITVAGVDGVTLQVR